MFVVFKTGRLLLRQFTLEDAKNLLLLNSDMKVLKYLHEAPLKNIKEAETVLANIILPQYKNNLGKWLCT